MGADAPVADPLIGRSFGSYQVLRLIGVGGMGAVYLAEQLRIGKQVAIKVLHPAYAGDERVVARFFREARLVNQIKHEHIIDVLDFGDDAHGAPYLIMELLEGESLATRLLRGPMSEARARHIGVQIASTLAAAHIAHAVHRDLKPDNIFMIRRGDDGDFVKVLDFGIAKLFDAPVDSSLESARKLTDSGALIGTPLYMAPEQIDGAEVGPATDIYALGCILYELVTGRPPFGKPGDDVAVLLKAHLKSPPPRPSRLMATLSAEYEEITLKCLAKAPADRFKNARQLELALERATTGAASAQSATLAAPPKRRSRPDIALAATAVATEPDRVTPDTTAPTPTEPDLPKSPAEKTTPDPVRAASVGVKVVVSPRARVGGKRIAVIAAAATTLVATGILVGLWLRPDGPPQRPERVVPVAQPVATHPPPPLPAPAVAPEKPPAAHRPPPPAPPPPVALPHPPAAVPAPVAVKPGGTALVLVHTSCPRLFQQAAGLVVASATDVRFHPLNAEPLTGVATSENHFAVARSTLKCKLVLTGTAMRAECTGAQTCTAEYRVH